MAEQTKQKKPGFFSRVTKWARELRAECRKIVWPTRQQTISNTIIVLVSVLIVGIFIGVLDVIFGFGVQALLSSFAA